MRETEISRAILGRYNERLLDSLENDVVIVGAGPAGLAAAYYLCKAGHKTVVLEKKLSIGGGIWGGAAGCNVLAFEDTEITDELELRTRKSEGLYLADSIEFASSLSWKACRAGAEVFNLSEMEDIVIKTKAVEGVVVNRASIRMASLPVDPFCIGCKFVVDATGHQAEVLKRLQARRPEALPERLKEGFMSVEQAEEQVVRRTGEVYPGLYVTGMSVCAAYNLPRMGPIFGGMLKSGKKVAGLINERL